MMNKNLKIDQRRSEIIRILYEKGRVQINELCDMLSVSSVTIRNDLKTMEDEGALIRIPGGAASAPGSIPAVSSGKNAVEKQRIAERIAGMIMNGTTLFMNSGTTTLAVAKALMGHKHLSVVTNSVEIAKLLGGVQDFRVILLGGEVNTVYGFTYGDDAQEQLSRYRADWAILAVDSISVEGGVTTYHPEEARINRCMTVQSGKTAIVADHSKVGRTGFVRFIESDKPVVLLTDDQADQEELSRLGDENVEVCIC